MFVLDTDILSLVFLGQHRVAERVIRHGDASPLAITVITRIEALRGRFASVLAAADGPTALRAVEWLKVTELRLSTLRTLDFDRAAADRFDQLRANKKLRSKKVGLADLMIASIALAHDATLVTRNTKDFAGVPNLRIENWAD